MGGLLIGTTLLYPVSLPSLLIPLRISGLSGLRVTDIMNLACAGLVLWAVLNSRRLHASCQPLGVVALFTCSWIGAELWYGWYGADSRLTVILMRWITSLASAYWLASRMAIPNERRWIIVGMIAGALIALGDLMIDPLGPDPSARHVVPLVWSGDSIRGAGIFDHPNGAAAATLLLVPLTLGFISERGYPRWYGLVTLIPIGAIYQITQTRSSSALATAMVSYWFCRHLRLMSILRYSFIGGLILLISGYVLVARNASPASDEIQIARLMNSREASTNASGRLQTILTSLDLTLQHPFGLASTYIGPLYDETGYSATHNAYLELSLLGGVVLTCYVTFRLWRTALLGFDSVEGLVAIYLSGAFFFENLLAQPQIIILCLWLQWRPARNVATS